MKRSVCKLALTFLLFLFLAPSSGQAQIPDPDTIQAVAVYRVIPGASDNLPDSLVNYNVTDSATIYDMFTGIEADTVRNCRLMEAETNGYVYAKFDSGERQVYHMYLRWSHISKKVSRRYCYYVNQSARDLFEYYAQE
jgi:hypothetical protein